MQTNKKATLSIPQSLIYWTLEIFIFHVHQNLCWAHTIHTMSSPQKKRCLWVKKKKADILLFYLLYCPWVTIRIIHSTADRAIMQSVWNSTNKYMHKCKCEKSLKNVKNGSLVYGIVSRKYSCWVAGIQRGRPTTTQIDIFLSTHTHLLQKCVHMKIKK